MFEPLLLLAQSKIGHFKIYDEQTVSSGSNAINTETVFLSHLNLFVDNKNPLLKKLEAFHSFKHMLVTYRH